MVDLSKIRVQTVIIIQQYVIPVTVKLILIYQFYTQLPLTEKRFFENVKTMLDVHMHISYTMYLGVVLFFFLGYSKLELSKNIYF